MTRTDRERVQALVDELEDVLENGSMNSDARRDLQQARDYAAGALPIWGHTDAVCASTDSPEPSDDSASRQTVGEVVQGGRR